MPDTSFKNCSDKLRDFLKNKGAMDDKNVKTKDLQNREYNELVLEYKEIFKQTEIDSCLTKMGYNLPAIRPPPASSGILSYISSFGVPAAPEAEAGAFHNVPEVSNIKDETKKFRIDIPIYVDDVNSTVTLGKVTTSPLSEQEKISGTLIASNTDPKTIKDTIGNIGENALNKFNKAYGNITDVKREKGVLSEALSKSIGLTDRGIISGLASTANVTSDFLKRLRGKETARDVRLFLDKLRDPSGNLLKKEYNELYTMANPGKYPDGQKWKTDEKTADGKTAGKLWEEVTAKETFTAKRREATSIKSAEEIVKTAKTTVDDIIDNEQYKYVIHPEYFKVLTDIKTALDKNKGWEFGKGEVEPIKVPSGSSYFGRWPGFVNDEYTNSSVANRLYKLSENLKSIDFNKNSTTVYDSGTKTNKTYNVPGWKGADIVLNFNKAHKFSSPEDFASQILNAGHGAATNYRGGRRTRKNKKSKTQKAGRKNKKTRKH